MKKLLALLLILYGSAFGTEATFTIKYGSARTRMSYMNASAATTNYGTSTSAVLSDSLNSSAFILIVDSCLLDSIRLRSLPYIKSFVLKLKFTLVPSANWPCDNTMKMWACRVRTAEWTEAQMTWNRAVTGVNWSTAGAKNLTNDIDTTKHCEISLSAPSNSDSLLVCDLTSLMQQMDATDTSRLYGGIILRQPLGTWTTWGGQMSFFSDDAATANQPVAVVTLTDVPQPPAGSSAHRIKRKKIAKFESTNPMRRGLIP